jgi:hypothetical protein
MSKSPWFFCSCWLYINANLHTPVLSQVISLSMGFSTCCIGNQSKILILVCTTLVSYLRIHHRLHNSVNTCPSSLVHISQTQFGSRYSWSRDPGHPKDIVWLRLSQKSSLALDFSQWWFVLNPNFCLRCSPNLTAPNAFYRPSFLS